MRVCVYKHSQVVGFQAKCFGIAASKGKREHSLSLQSHCFNFVFWRRRVRRYYLQVDTFDASADTAATTACSSWQFLSFVHLFIPGSYHLVTMPDKVHVIVVGAGISGLCAAKTLTEHGLDVRVLEATGTSVVTICYSNA